MLKLIIKSLDEVAEPLREFYKPAEDGRFVFQADDIRDHPDVLGLKTTLDKALKEKKSARDEAKQLKDQLEELGASPDEIKEILAEHGKAKDKKLLDEGKVEELINQRLAKARQDYDKQLASLTGERDQVSSKLSELLIDKALMEAATKGKVRETAIEDVLSRGKRVWKLKDNQPVPMDGDTVIYGKDPTKPISMGEWMGELQNTAPHLFEGSSGGGASGSGNGGGSGSVKYIPRAEASKHLAAIERGEVMIRD